MNNPTIEIERAGNGFIVKRSSPNWDTLVFRDHELKEFLIILMHALECGGLIEEAQSIISKKKGMSDDTKIS